jgi:NADPH:quinone reductase-like Zn-dependent oxidoreductase
MKQFIGKGLAAGVLRLAVAKIFPFDEIVAAHRYIEAGEQIGKVVITV